MMKYIKSEIIHEKSAWFLLITSAIFFLLRLPSLFEPYWYGDEGIYEAIGYALRHGRLLYSGIWDNKPPILYLIYAVFNGNQMGARFLSFLAGLGAVWAIFFLSKTLFERFKPAAMTTAIFAFLFGIPLIEGNIANAENFMLLPGILAGLLVYKTIKKHPTSNDQRPTTILLLAAGLLLGLSFLTKIVALFDFAAFASFIFLVSLNSISIENIVFSLKKAIPLIAGFTIPIVLCSLFFIFNHTFDTFLKATFQSNVGYVNYGNQFLIPQGFLIFKTLLLGGFVLLLFVKRNKILPSHLLIFLWTIFSIYSGLFSGRNYTHYALVIIPSFTLLFGLLYIDKKLQKITGIVMIFVLIILIKSFTYYGHFADYYLNFTQYILGQKSTAAYESFFDRVTPRDIAISEYINMHLMKSENIFVWGNSGQIYRLTNTLPPGRFIVAYHITMNNQNYTETQKILLKNPPTYIIILPYQSIIPYSLYKYKEKLIIDGATIYKHV